MFSCSACFRRALTVLLSDLPSTSISTSTSTSKSISTVRTISRNHGGAAASTRRQHSTVASIRKGHHRRFLRETLASKGPIPLKKTTLRKGPSPPVIRDLRARERNRATLGIDTPVTSSHPDAAGNPDRQVLRGGQAKEQYAVQFLRDPLKLASTVLGRLRLGDVQGALALVRASDREKVENVVSWNHIMDYAMSVQDVKGALKVYNEMKKRGHKPDAHTYTIMLRGFVASIRKPQAVQNALSVYNSMFAPNSTVTPNIIHTNAIINVCARGKDMDALWSVAGRLPETGPGAPDKWTFTTIMNALASNAQTKASQLQQGRQPEEHDEQVRKVFDDAVEDGRKLWGDVVTRWRKGDLMVDQPLVCAMGRLLLLGSRKSGWEDVFGLVEQTMNIPRWRPGGEEQKTLPPPPPTTTTTTQSGFEPVQIETAAGEEKTGPGKMRASAYAQPGNNALGMLVQAAIMTKNVPAGKMYWDLLTDANGPYKLEPDAANLASYMRLLRISRASKMVVDLLRSELFATNQTLAKDFYKRGTFVMAMSTCVRDKNNPNVFEHANRVVDMMQDRLPDEMVPKVLEMYVNLAVLTTPGVSGVSPWREGKFDVGEVGRMNAVRALRRVGPLAVNVKDMMKARLVEEDLRGRRGRIESISRRETDGGGGASVDDLAAFLSAMVGAYDRLLSRGAETGVPRGLLEEWLGQKRKLSAFVTKMVGRATGSGTRAGDGDTEEGEVDLEGVESEMKDRRWERNAVRPEMRRAPLTKAEKRAERLKKDFPHPRELRRLKQQDEEERQRQAGLPQEGVVLKSWGTAAFEEMEKQQQGDGKIHGMAL